MGKKQHFPWEQELTEMIGSLLRLLSRGSGPPPPGCLSRSMGFLAQGGIAHRGREGAGCRAPRRASVWRSRVWKSSRITHPTVAAAPGLPVDEGSEMKWNRVQHMTMFGNSRCSRLGEKVIRLHSIQGIVSQKNVGKCA